MNRYRKNHDCNIPPTPRHDISGYKRMRALRRNPDGTVSNFYVYPKREPSDSSINAYQGNLLNTRSGRSTPDYERSSRLRAGAPPQCQDQGYAEFLRLMGEMGNANMSDYQPPPDELSDWEAACIPPPIATNNVDIPKYQSANAYNSESMYSPRSSNSYNIKSQSLPKYDDFDPMVTSSFTEEFSSNDSSGGLRRSLVPQDLYDYLMQDATAHDEDFRTIPCIENSSYESSNISVHAPVASLSSSYGEQSSLHESRIPLECNHTECQQAASLHESQISRECNHTVCQLAASLHESQIPLECNHTECQQTQYDYSEPQFSPSYAESNESMSFREGYSYSQSPSMSIKENSSGPCFKTIPYIDNSSYQSSNNFTRESISPQEYSSNYAEEDLSQYYGSYYAPDSSRLSISQQEDYSNYTGEDLSQYYGSDQVPHFSPISISSRGHRSTYTGEDSSQYYNYEPEYGYSPENCSALSSIHAESSVRPFTPRTPQKRYPDPLQNYKQHKAEQMYSRVAKEPRRNTRLQRDLTFKPRDQDVFYWPVIPSSSTAGQLPTSQKKSSILRAFSKKLSKMFGLQNCLKKET